MYPNPIYALMRPVSLRALPPHKIVKKLNRGYSTEIDRVLNLKFNNAISVRVMEKHDLAMTMKWAAQEGWNPGKYEVEPFYAADPRGFKILEVDGEPIASLANVRYSSKLAFLGLYIVKPAFRGQGYGKLLWDICMGNLVEAETIGLNSVIHQVENYQRSGFVSSHSNTRWQGVSAIPLIKTNIEKNIILKKKEDFSFSQLVDYDAKLFFTPRAAFLKKWLGMPESHVLAAIDGGTLRGYGVISATQEGYKIAPLFADNEIIAEKLYYDLCHYVPRGASIHIDTSETNPFSSAFAKKIGLKESFNTIRMYKGKPLSLPQDNKVFGLTTLEMG